MSSLEFLSNNSYHEVPASTFFKRMSELKNYTLIDLRRAEEFLKGSIQGAINLDLLAENFFTDIAKISVANTLFIYCSNGKRSGIAGKQLCRMGYETVGLLGGYMSLSKEQAKSLKSSN